ncbi:MAG: hypothetical protein K6E92_05470 [Lachnospiraceae bacterium]|nr:hypothetical protein [Lachnospiraceae bacterium]
MPVKKLKYGVVVEKKDQDNVPFEEYEETLTVHSPIRYMNAEGAKGRLYLDKPFDLSASIIQLVQNMRTKYPKLAPYFNLSMEKIASIKESPSAVLSGLSMANYFGPMAHYHMGEPFLAELFDLGKHFEDAGPDPRSAYPAGTKLNQQETNELNRRIEERSQQASKIFTELPGMAEAAVEIAEELKAICSMEYFRQETMIPDGQGVSRNMEACGEIATLIGNEDLVADTARVYVQVDGKVGYGTFVSEPDGKKVFDGPEDNIFLDKNNNPLKQPGAMKALADLQVMDLISGVTKMDVTDLTFVMDPFDPTKISRIVRHKVPPCFGTFDATATATGIGDLVVISEGTAEMVAKMTREDLEAALDGKGMEQTQIDACWGRVQELQEKIKEASYEFEQGKLKIVKDEEWAQMDPDRLYVKQELYVQGKEVYQKADLTSPSNTHNNIFRHAWEIRSTAKLLSAKRGTEEEAILADVLDFGDKPKDVTLIGEKNVTLAMVAGRLDEVDPYFIRKYRGSDEFRQLRAAVEDLSNTIKDLSRQTGGSMHLSPQQMATLTEKYANAESRAEIYMQKKNREAVKGRTGPERYRFAQSVQTYTRKMRAELKKQMKVALEEEKPVIKPNVMGPA